MANGDLAKGFVLGLAAAAVIPLAVIALGSRSRPVGRAMSRGAGLVSDRARQTAAELGEILEDMLAELRHEPSQDRAAHEPHVRPVETSSESGPRAASAE